MTRRDFTHLVAATAATAATAARSPGVIASAAQPAAAASSPPPWFRISLAEWSLHRALGAGKIENTDFARLARAEFNIEGIEYVNSFFKDKARDARYLAELNRRADDAGVKQLLIMIDGEGALGDPDPARRTRAVENHHRWVEAAKTLGCHSIRVNARSEGTWDEQLALAAVGLRELTEFAAALEINVIVENHGGLSSNGKWLGAVMQRVDHERCGTLPDFGNFRVSAEEEYDRYQGVTDLMPYARAVSAKSYDFDDAGHETKIDYERMIRIVHDAGYHAWIGVEYEGERLDEYAGIRATKALLERERARSGA